MILRKRPDHLTLTIKHHLIQTDGDFKIPFQKSYTHKRHGRATETLQN